MREVIVESSPAWLPTAIVPWPDTLWLFAILIAFATTLRFVARAGLNTRVAFWAGLCGIAGALAIGRLWIALFDPHAGGWRAALDILEGEKSVMGAAIGVGLGAGFWLYLSRQPVLHYLDAAVPAVFLGYAVGRVGCLLVGCCFGTPTDLPWGIHYPPGSNPYLAHVAAGLIESTAVRSLAVHPIPHYHVLLALVLCRLTLGARGADGRPVAVALVGYGLGRFLLEFIRGDAISTAIGLSVAQLGCIAFILGGFILWLVGRGFVGHPIQATAP